MKKVLISLTLIMTACSSPAGFDRDWTFWSDTDTARRTVNIPHDAMQTESRQDTLEGGRHNGFFPGNVYHYEKVIDAPASWLDKHVTVHFEGVYQKASISLNGMPAGENLYGYNAFDVCLDGLLKKGANILRVDVDNADVPNSRWYTGAGIYRPATLTVREKNYIQDVKVSTLSIAPAHIHLSIKADGDLHTRILCQGKEVASADGSDVELEIPDAQLWNDVHPHLYEAVVELRDNGKTVDTRTAEFGIRTISWSAEGLKVNGENVLLRGGCLHHDNGVIGARELEDAAVRKLTILKQYGYNAIRSSHNPMSETLLRVCDRMGFYVMDELWDTWTRHKTPYDCAAFFPEHHLEDVARIVEKDFNHPSVIMYSIGNEVTEPAAEEGMAIAKELADGLHKMDPSRPVTAGINMVLIYMSAIGLSWDQISNGGQMEEMSSEQYNAMVSSIGDRMMQATLMPEADAACMPVLDLLDIAGYNYASPRYDVDPVQHPGRISVGSETYCGSLSRNWACVEKYPGLIGDFQWTAWDYIGEVSLGAWYNSDETPGFGQLYPALLAGSGALDLLGHPTGEAFLAKAVWQKDGKPYLAVRPVSPLPVVKAVWRTTNSIPSWSWQGCEGLPATVEVFTSAPSVKLYLNDELIEEKAVTEHVASFELPYSPGTLRAVTEAGSSELISADADLHLSVRPEKASYKAGDLVYVDIDLAGANGSIESNADRLVKVSVEGGELIGFGSAQPRTEARFPDGCYPTYYGRSLAVIRTYRPGTVRIRVSAEGMETVKKNIKVQ